MTFLGLKFGNCWLWWVVGGGGGGLHDFVRDFL